MTHLMHAGECPVGNAESLVELDKNVLSNSQEAAGTRQQNELHCDVLTLCNRPESVERDWLGQLRMSRRERADQVRNASLS